MTFYDARTARFAPARRVVLCLLALALLTVPACTRAPSPEAPADARSDSLTTPAGGNTADSSPDSSTVESSARAETLRLATLNTEFLFDGVGKEGQTGFARSGDPQAAHAHMQRVARLIQRLDADVLMLQEVENEAVLLQLTGGPLGNLGYTAHFVQGTDYFTEQDIGLLSRLPVAATGRTDERAPVAGTSDDYGVSKNLYARLRWNGLPLTLIGVHFLARPDDASRRDKREAQAEVIRRLVAREQRAGRTAVVLGDLNDFDADTPDAASSRPITGVLQIVKRAGPGPEDDLRSVMPRVPQPQRYTAFYDRNRDDAVDPASELSAIDHLLVGPALYAHLQRVRYVHEHDPVAGPDHFPILATFAPGETTAPRPANTRR
jgi:endonuclease/exonuclease/phosphatase family metal-dependent hydrolase